ncbi:purine-nucleoside phosphorylase [Bdellovibrionota bacterium FG-2]
MERHSIYQQIRDAVEAIQSRCVLKPQVGIIVGSGLGSIADEVQDPTTIPYAEIPHFFATSVEGSSGRLVLGLLKGVPVALLHGRFHSYEGYTMEQEVFPTRTLCGLGIQTLLTTNAAGAVNQNYKPCDLMLVEDHLNLMGNNPLKGSQLSDLGPRFPDLSEAYNRVCLQILERSAKSIGLKIQKGVYAGLMGPTYETPAEIRMLRTLGADAVGMSTVPESIAANHLGVQVAGISCITNYAAGMSPQKLTHSEVIENSKKGAVHMKALIEAALPELARSTQAPPLTHDSKEHPIIGEILS